MLRNQQTGRDVDRHEHPIPRPKRARVNDDEDGPTYVYAESNDTLSRVEFDTLVAGTTPGELGGQDELKMSEKPDGAALGENIDPDLIRKKQDITEVGIGLKKRKAAKILGTADTEEDVPSSERNKPKKKSKAVKLTFGID